MPAWRARCDGQGRGIVTDRSVEPVPVAAVRKVELLLFRGGHEQRLCGLRAMAATQVVAVGGRRDHRRDRDHGERDHDLDQGEAGGGTSLRHDVLTGSPE